MKRYRDEDGNILTLDELKAHFDELKASGELDEKVKFGGYMFDVTGKDGFLTEVNEEEENMENRINELVKELSEENALYKWVIEDIMEDVDGYEGSRFEQIKTRLSEITEHGCISGTVGALIYYSDCEKIFDKLSDEVGEHVGKLCEEYGENVIGWIKDYDKLDPFCRTAYNKCYVMWLVYEDIAREFSDRLEELEEE